MIVKEFPCPLCESKGQIKIVNQYKPCPMCLGDGKVDHKKKDGFFKMLMGKKAMYYAR